MPRHGERRIKATILVIARMSAANAVMNAVKSFHVINSPLLPARGMRDG
jgi:hypothetical protein